MANKQVAIKVVEVIEHELEGIQLEVDILKFCKILKCCELLVDLSQSIVDHLCAAVEKASNGRIQSFRTVRGGDDNECLFVKLFDSRTIFVKFNTIAKDAKEKFEAEMKALQEIKDTNTIRVPIPEQVGTFEDGAFFMMEYIKFANSGSAAKFGEQLAKLHLSDCGEKFGYPINNTCGRNQQINTPMEDDWIQFYMKNRIGFQLELINKKHNDTELEELINKLNTVVHKYFEGIKVKPSLLHGDLWSGNWGYDQVGNGVIFDPACYYGHSEAELSILAMFGAPPKEFYTAYHELIPKENGFEERHKLYKLYHFMNHYSIFGKAYRNQCMEILQDLTK